MKDNSVQSANDCPWLGGCAPSNEYEATFELGMPISLPFNITQKVGWITIENRGEKNREMRKQTEQDTGEYNRSRADCTRQVHGLPFELVIIVTPMVQRQY